MLIVESSDVKLNEVVDSDDSASLYTVAVAAMKQKYPVLPCRISREHLVVSFDIFEKNENGKERIGTQLIRVEELENEYRSRTLSDYETDDIILTLIDHFSFAPVESLSERESKIAQILVGRNILKVENETYEKV